MSWGHLNMSSVSNSYIKQVLKQVKFIVDHRSIKRELNSHIQDLIDEHQWHDLSERDLNLKILEEMGDPIDLGQSLNQVHKPILGYIWVVSRSIFIIVLCLSLYNFVKVADRTIYQKPNIMNEFDITILLESIGTQRNLDYSHIKYREWIIQETIDFDKNKLIIERVIITEDNNLILVYRNLPKFDWLNRYNIVYLFNNLKIMDQNNIRYFPSYDVQMSMNDSMISLYTDVPYDTQTIKMDFKQVKESFTLTVNGDDYE